MTRTRHALELGRGVVLGVCAVAAVVGLTVGVGGQGDVRLPRSAAEVTAGSVPGPAAVEVAARPATPRRTPPPVRLDIPAIDLSTRLIRLGLEPDRTVEVPADPERAGWFELGTAPGASGSAVILGHVDSVSGPAVFARLRDLDPGDVVRVARSDGSVAAFEVVRLALYPNEEFPAQRVYAATGHGGRLNLVTCGGDYDAGRGGYQSNLVVYTRRADRS